MKGDPAVPGSPLTSKPTWSNAFRCSTTSVFFHINATTKCSRCPSTNTPPASLPKQTATLFFRTTAFPRRYARSESNGVEEQQALQNGFLALNNLFFRDEVAGFSRHPRVLNQKLC